MVLTNSHTISKNIDDKEEFDSIVDSFNDLDYKRINNLHRSHQHNYYKRDDKEDTANTELRRETANVTKGKLKEATTNPSILVSTSPKRKSNKQLHSFWNKFRHRWSGNKENKDGRVHKRKSPKKSKFNNINGVFEGKYQTKNTPILKNDLHRRGISKSYQDKRKRNISVAPSSVTPALINNFTASTKDATVTCTPEFVGTDSGITNTLSSKFGPTKSYELFSTTKSMFGDLTEMTTRLSQLKETYGLAQSKITPNLENMNVAKTFHSTTSSTPTMDLDFPGTAQIEALLNDIKMKAIEMVAEQNPAVTDMIANTVTETTFAADPILTHLDMRSTGYALSTFISIDVPNSKRTVDFNETVVISNTEPTHIIGARSIQEDVYTIAHNIEDLLQRELKKAYGKAKVKVQSQWNKEVKQASSTIKSKSTKMMEKDTKALSKSHYKTCKTKKMSTPISNKQAAHTKSMKKGNNKQVRRSTKNNKVTENLRKTETTHVPLPKLPSTFDDYMMLTLFEHILAKTHQDNVMKMLTTTDVPFNKRNYKKRDVTTIRIAKSEVDPKLKENFEVSDDYDTSNTPESYPEEPLNTENTLASTVSETEDTSFEGLSNKISYNDYVNGYKHYLKFQKEQGEQNFSNLVRYQAHLHHSVDDIGKYILNKIPNLTAKRNKRFFEDYNEDDMSTKSDDSWFKKHFYFFIDSGPPKKYHTSQTVALKSPISNLESSSENGLYKSKWSTANSVNTQSNEDEESEEFNLDELSKDLYERKSKQFSSFDYGEASTIGPSNTNKKLSRDMEHPYSFRSIGLVGRLFGGKRGTTATHIDVTDNMLIEPLDDKPVDEVSERDKRNINIDEKSNAEIAMDMMKATTPHSLVDIKHKNYGYVDVNLIPKPTTIVKLRENKGKKGRMRKFFNKFRFHKRKKPQKTKRENRAFRFNPFRKFKEFLKGRPGATDTYSYQKDSPHDYDMLTSRIFTFKPVKYDRILSLEEINREIPNITDVSMETDMALPKYSPKQNPLSWDSKPLLHQPTHSTQYKFTTDPSIGNAKRTFQTATTSMNKLYKSTTAKQTKAKVYDYGRAQNKVFESTTAGYNLSSLKYNSPIATKTHKKDENTKRYEPNKIDSILNDNLLKTSLVDYQKFTTEAYDPTLRLVDIKNELNAMQRKLTEPTFKTVAVSPSSSPVKPQRIYVPQYLQAPPHEAPNNLKIHKKLIRVAKFPLPHLNHAQVTKNTNVYSIEASNKTCRASKREIEKDTFLPLSTLSLINDLNIHSEHSRLVNCKPYPDYFNDLLMWHGDLLNTDKITSPSWENIIDSIQESTKSYAQSSVDMQQEINQLNQFLRLHNMNSTMKEKSSKIPRRNKKDKTQRNYMKQRNLIKTIAIHDDAVAKTDNMFIKGEAKYYHIAKQPFFAGKYLETAAPMNNLERMYFKPYNIRGQYAKRNGNFWKNDIDQDKKKHSDDNEDSPVLFLDTTLLSYDDGPDSLSDKSITKNISKNSLTSARPSASHKIANKPIAKINESPAQYFSTPLPMEMNDFERFLKDNHIDVQSVTRPLTLTPQIVNQLYSKNKPNDQKSSKQAHFAHTKKAVNTTNTTKKSPVFKTKTDSLEYDMNNLFDAEVYLNNDKSDEEIGVNFDKRIKKNSQILDNSIYPTKPDYRDTIKKSRNGLFKNKIRLFDKRPTTMAETANSKTTSNGLDDSLILPVTDESGSVELTIINMEDLDDQNKQTPNRQTEVEFREPWRAVTVPKQRLFAAASTRDGKKSRPTTKRKSTETIKTKSTGDVKNDQLSNVNFDNTRRLTQDKLGTDTELFNVPTSLLPQYISTDFFKHHSKHHHPKRVKISSHNYKYDIIYDNKNKYSGKRDVRFPYATTTEASAETQLVEPKNNSEAIEIIRIVKAVEAVENFTRPNVIIHIDLPTYYDPYTGPTEPIWTGKPKSVWNDIVLKYLSGLALLELLHKFGILKIEDGALNFTDGVDNAVNAS
ncbi:hypothetical protein evm_001672 [Chilo suppressalis]|nr:hypothetical protein evm_001672 [Chilo suppressalis]